MASSICNAHSTAEVLAYIRATVCGGDPELGFLAFIQTFRQLSWQDRVLEISRYIGTALLFTGLVLLNLVRDSNIIGTSRVCTFYFSYWLVACILFGFAFIPLLVAAILQLFTLVPPLTPHAAAASLDKIFQSLGPSGSAATDQQYVNRAKQCQCMWTVVDTPIRGHSYPLFNLATEFNIAPTMFQISSQNLFPQYLFKTRHDTGFTYCSRQESHRRSSEPTLSVKKKSTDFSCTAQTGKLGQLQQFLLSIILFVK